MKKSKAIIYSIVFQIAISLIVLDYQFNPSDLQIECLAAHASSNALGSGKILDCIACQSFANGLFDGQFIGYISILIPLEDQSLSTRLDSRLPFDSTQIQNNKLHEELLYVASVFTQKGCSEYECKPFHKLQDFNLRKKQNINLLNEHNIELNQQITFGYQDHTYEGINYPLRYALQQPSVALISNNFLSNQLSSMIIRARYSITEKIDGDKKPSFLIHKLKTDIYARVIFILVALLQSGRLLSLLSHFTNFIKICLFILLSAGFISPTAAILSSALAIYLTFAKLHHSHNKGLILSFTFILLSYLHLYRSFSLIIPSLFVFTYAFLLSAKQLRDHLGLVEVGAFANIFTAGFFMWNQGWSYFILLVPLLQLSSILAVKEEKQIKNTRYDLINLNDEEQDVLSRIERELR